MAKMIKTNRRKLLKAVSTGIVSSTGLGVGTSAALGSGGNEPTLTELKGKEKNKFLAKARKSSEFKSLKKHVMNTYAVRPAVRDASAYAIEDGDEKRFGVEIPLSGIENSVHSVIVIVIEDGAVTTGTGGTATVDGERVTEYTQFKVVADGTVTSESIPLATDEQRRAIFEEYGRSDVRLASQCSDCEWAISRLCGWGCGISGAFFCGAIGVAYPIAGIGCGALFALYCYELDASGACFYKGSAKADCEFMGYC